MTANVAKYQERTPIREIQEDRSATKTRICFVISHIETEQAGTEGHLLRLIQALRQRNYDPSLVVLQRSKWTDETEIDGVPIHVLGFRSFRRPGDWNSIRRLAALFKDLKPHVAELYFTDAHVIGSIASRLAKVPATLSWRRDLGYQYGKKEVWLSRLGNRFVDRLIANSSAVADRISQIERIDRQRFEIIHNGIDLAEFDRRSQLAVSPEFENVCRGKQVVCIAANLRPIKNVQLFLDAASHISQRRDDVAFVILGDGPDRQALQGYAERLQLSDRILWQGSVPSIAPYVSRSDIACLTSDSEGFSNSVIEYMAAGKPVVATRVGGTPEAVVDGVTGFLTEPRLADPLAGRVLHLLADADLRREMGRAGRARAQNQFSFEHQVSAQCRLYQRLRQSTNQ